MNMIQSPKNNESSQKETKETDAKKIESKLIQTATFFSGPIPPPEVLFQYEQLLKGSADRILKMTELQVNHRHAIENKELEMEISQSQSHITIANKEMSERKLGQIFAFSITMTTIIGGGVLSFFGKPIVGSLFGGAGLVSILIVFYSNRIPFFNKRNNNQNPQK